MPKYIIVDNISRGIQSPSMIKYCDTFLSQLRGFTFRPQLNLDDGLILVGKRDSRIDSAITMLFVSFDLGVIWINSQLEVVDKKIARSWKLSYFSNKPAMYVLEIHPDREKDFQIGDIVEFNDV